LATEIATITGHSLADEKPLNDAPTIAAILFRAGDRKAPEYGSESERD
jgi:hypothetical protein